MVPPDTGRQRASRIPLDYFKTPVSGSAAKALATIAVVVAAAAWWTGGILLGRQDAAFHSPGSLASVHHTWESQCSACHADFHADPRRRDCGPLGGRHARLRPEMCNACHQGAEHHPVKQGSEAPGCSSCHHDHQGLQASLLRMDDRACTRCHQAIEQHAAISSIDGETSQMSSLTNVTRFDKEHHPEFASAQEGPRSPEILALSPLDAGPGQRSARREDGLDPGQDRRPGPAQALPASRAARRPARAARLRFVP